MNRILNILRHFEKRKRVRNIHFVGNKAPFLVQVLTCPKKACCPNVHTVTIDRRNDPTSASNFDS